MARTKSFGRVWEGPGDHEVIITDPQSVMARRYIIRDITVSRPRKIFETTITIFDANGEEVGVANARAKGSALDAILASTPQTINESLEDHLERVAVDLAKAKNKIDPEAV